jgi:hypothetical protein
MFRVMFAVLAIAAGCSLPARAADVTPDVDSHLAAAMDLLDVTNAKTNMTAMVDSLIPVIMNQIKTQHPNLTGTVADEFQIALRDEMTGSLDDLMKLTGRVYERYFTEDDLRTLAAFYRTEVGRRFTDAMPMIFKDTLPLGTIWGREAGMRAAQRALERLRAKGLNL